MDATHQPPIEPDNTGMLATPEFSAKTHRPKPPRCKDPTQARSVHDQLFDNDTERRIERAQVQAMGANKRPFDQTSMEEAGLGGCSNIDFRYGSDAMLKELGPYANIFVNTREFMHVETRAGTPDQRKKWNIILSTGHTRMLRAWPEFMFRYLYCAQYKSYHGTAFAYFDNADDWRWFIAATGEILVPELSKTDTEDFGVVSSSREYMVNKLFAEIKGFTEEDYKYCEKKWKKVTKVLVDEKGKTRTEESEVEDEGGEYGRYMGWHLPSLIEAMEKATEKEFIVNNDFDLAQREWEALEMYYSRSEKVVRCIVQWWTEGDGKVSQYICVQNPMADGAQTNNIFLFKQESRFKDMSDCIVMFNDNIGTNGYLHTVHGRGSAMYPMVQKLTELKNHCIDATDVGLSIPISGSEEVITSELAYTRSGPFFIIHRNITFPEVKFTDHSKSTIPLLEMLDADRLQVLPKRPAQDQSETEALFAQLQGVDPLSAALWYHGFDRLLKKSLDRIKNCKSSAESGGEYIWGQDGFRAYCLDNGIPPEMIDEVFEKIDIHASYAIMPIGMGSPAAAFTCYEQMEKLVPFMDEMGKNNWARDKAMSLPGMHPMHVDRYFPEVPDSRPGVETSIAQQENALFELGASPDTIQVLPDQPHLLHLHEHAGKMEEYMEKVESGELSRMEASTKLYGLYIHAEKHIEDAGDNPLLKKEVNEFKRAVEVCGEVIVNGQRELQAAQKKRAQQQAAGQPQEGGQLPGGLNPKQFEAVEKAKVRLQEASAKWAIKEWETKMLTQQKMQHADAITAAKIAANATQQG